MFRFTAWPRPLRLLFLGVAFLLSLLPLPRALAHPMPTTLLVLDLATLRGAGFVEEFLPFLPAFGLRWRELLSLYAGPDRAEVPPRWDVVPAHDVVDEPRLLRWPDPPKPWQAMAVPGDQAWQSVRLPPEPATSAATGPVRRRRVNRPW